MAESIWWSAPERANDDNDNAGASYELFEAYKAVPNFLGHVLELGCGPFTQLRTILGAPGHQYEVWRDAFDQSQTAGDGQEHRDRQTQRQQRQPV